MKIRFIGGPWDGVEFATRHDPSRVPVHVVVRTIDPGTPVPDAAEVPTDPTHRQHHYQVETPAGGQEYCFVYQGWGPPGGPRPGPDG